MSIHSRESSHVIHPYEPIDSGKHTLSLNGSEWGLTTTAWGTTKASALRVMSVREPDERERENALPFLHLSDFFTIWFV